MKLMSYLEVREQIDQWCRSYKVDLTDKQIEQVIAWSGHRADWVEKAVKWLAGEREGEGAMWVEEMGLGREILSQMPILEQVYLYNPSLADQESWLVKQGIVEGGRIVSSALGEWLGEQSKREMFTLSQRPFTQHEAKLIKLLFAKKEQMVGRDEIGGQLWGEEWSDWELDALISRIRRKLTTHWKILTVRGLGYMLLSQTALTHAPRMALGREESLLMITKSILPSDEYLTYMNDQSRPRKVYGDLFLAMQKEEITNPKFSNSQINILCVNSYSYDNVDSVVAWEKEAKIYFVHYDERAIDLHKERVRELGVENRVEVWHDDMRESKLKNDSFDLVINDFRLNFNRDDRQNSAMMKNTWRILKPGGIALISTVVDGRYESTRYGIDQEKAPINAIKPGLFQADEHLVRRSWSVPYYRQLFGKTGFVEVKEFDIEEGKRWGVQPTLTTNPWSGPFYRRWWMRR